MFFCVGAAIAEAADGRFAWWLAALAAAPADEKVRARLDSWKDDLARDVWVEECARILSDMAKPR